MHAYRSHTCAQLNSGDVGQTVRLSGWVHRVRDHGGVLFIDEAGQLGLADALAVLDLPHDFLVPGSDSRRAALLEKQVAIDHKARRLALGCHSDKQRAQSDDLHARELAQFQRIQAAKAFLSARIAALDASLACDEADEADEAEQEEAEQEEADEAEHEQPRATKRPRFAEPQDDCF